MAAPVTFVRFTRRIRCEVYSRVVGYFRPIDNWNDGKKAEFHDRRTYDATKAMRHAIVHGDGDEDPTTCP